MARKALERDVTKPETVGFAPGIPGHELTYVPPAANQYWGEQWNCTCGLNLHANMRKNGTVGTHGQRSWRIHLQAQETPPDEILPVGVIHKQRVDWEIFVLSRGYSGAAEFATGYSQGWLRHNPNNAYDAWHWAVGAKRVSKKGETIGCQILSTQRSQTDALHRAREYMEKQAGRGIDVTYGIEDLAPPPLKVDASFVSLLDRVDKTCEEGTLLDVEAMLSEVRQVLAMTPVLEKRVSDLEGRRAAIVAGMLNEPQAI